METPILIIGFNRPDRLRAVLAAVAEAAPSRVYIAVDGPRSPADLAMVAATREAAEEVEWPAEKHLRLRDRNLGCRLGVIDAVSWFLRAEPAGMIIEDDSIPDPTFYAFAEDLLRRYRARREVLSIAGENRVPPAFIDSDWSYRFSFMGPAGAWATWRDRWFGFVDTRIDASLVQTTRALRASGNATALQTAHWTAMMLANRTAAVDSWAYPFMVHGIANGMLTATPNRNLVRDTGVGSEARHMSESDPLAQPISPLMFPLSHPRFVALDRRAEAWSNAHEVGATAAGLAGNGLRLGRRVIRRG